MTRCFVDPAHWNQPEVVLSSEESHHLLNVLRARRDQPISIFNGQGRVAQAEVIGTVNGQVRIKILEETRYSVPHPSVLISLIQAIPKHSLMDVIIQKATELGISAIHPVLTQRVIVRLNKQDAQQRSARWQRIALEAAKQCGANWLPDIHPLIPLNHLLPQLAHLDLCVVASIHKETKPIREVIKTLNKTNLKTIGVVIGPEGDFSDEETTALRSAGGVPVSFGPLVLRVETAALFGISILAYEFLEL